MPHTIADLNAMTQAEFVSALGDLFEDTPAIAAQTWHDRPFTDPADLYQKLIAHMQSMTPADQLALIRAHPDLGSRATMAAASVQEQAGAGLDRLTPAEYDRFQALNQNYKTKFGFPFIIAVKQQTRASILDAFDRRLQNSLDDERQQALSEIAQIVQFRLSDRIVLT